MTIISKKTYRNLKAGDRVVVSEPKHLDSQHIYSFVGTVDEVFDDYVCVRDCDDEIWEIEFDEILSIGGAEA